MFERIRRNSRRVAGAAAIAAMAAVGIAWPAHASGQVYRITTVATLAVDVAGSSTSALAHVVQWPINGGLNQEWTLEEHPGGSWIVNVNSGQCLSVGSKNAGEGVVQYPCIDDPTDEWKFEPVNSGTAFVIRNAYSDLVLDVPRGTGNWGTQLIQWPANGNPNQFFWFYRL